jgi:hypothetical protein
MACSPRGTATRRSPSSRPMRRSAERIFLPLSVGGGGAIRQIIVSHTLDWSDRPPVTLAIAEQVADRTDTIERLN